MPKFEEPQAQREYEAQIASGIDAGEAHENVERRRLNGEFIAAHLRTKPRIFSIVGSDDQKRIARLRGVQDMAERDPDKYDQYLRQAKMAGVSIAGKSYESGLAAYPGDPDAWVKDDHDIKQLAKQKGCFTSKEDGLLKISVPLDPREKATKQMLARKRNTKPVSVRRKNKEREIANK